MDNFKRYTQQDILSLVNTRIGEQKLGENVQVVADLDHLKNVSAQFVLLGIPEDIGVRANHGIGGTKTAWNAALKTFLNIQSNPFLQGEEVLVLGHFEIEEPKDQSIDGLRKKVDEIDSLVFPIIEKIVAAGKIPIIIGGGHNNAAPLIWGSSLALKQAINIVNIDAHADLRNPAEGRHSGNGFSYAMQNAYLNQYRIFGLHQNYVNQALPNQIATNQNISVVYFEDLLQSPKNIPENWADFTDSLATPCGLEIDLDSIENLMSSAVSPSGFTLNDIRSILLGNTKKYTYLHLCEGAVAMEDGRTDQKTGKAIAYLVSDFIKALRPHI